MAKINIEKMSINIGAYISGVDLTKPIDPDTFFEIREAWLENQIIVIRDQHVSPQQYKKFAENFGPLERHEFHRNLGPGLEEVADITFDGSRPRNSTADLWHIDGGYYKHPTVAALLMPVDIPKIGGDTAFASRYCAYDALPGPLQRMCEEIEALHSAPMISAADVESNKLNPDFKIDPEDLAGRAQPVVIVHPETGRKALYVDRMFTRHIVGFPEAESRHILDMLYEVSTYNLEFQTRHTWRMGDIAIWDDRAVLHYGVTDYRVPRTMRRITVAGSERLLSPREFEAARRKEAVPRTLVKV
jgi:taurine dioxygenase